MSVATEARVDYIDLEAALAARYVGFVGFLRENGLRVASVDGADAMNIADRMGQFSGPLLRWSLRALLCSRAEDWARFDGLFATYFLPPNRQALVETHAGGAGQLDLRDEAGGLRDSSEGNAVAGGAGNDSAEADGGAAQHGASGDEALARADFQHLNQPDEVRALDALIRRFAQRLRLIALRREQAANSGLRIDLARTIRRSVAHGGLPLDLAWRQKRRVRPRLILLLDVSRSMSLYSFFYLRLARALSSQLTDVHCFLYHTQLVGIGEALRDPDPWRSQERLQLLSAGWAGGTRIGDCLSEFNQRHGRTLLHARSAVIIVSDGYNTGPPDKLVSALTALRRRARRLVWLNPLASRPGYTPSSAGMQAALPCLDLFAPGSDLASIERVLPQLLRTLQ
ncbi:vWA domain-containing protein [Actimicrobium antarcticum]